MACPAASPEPPDTVLSTTARWAVKAVRLPSSSGHFSGTGPAPCAVTSSRLAAVCEQVTLVAAARKEWEEPRIW